jgi:hypothetical protein
MKLNRAVVIPGSVAFWCAKCKKSTNVMYYTENGKYCSHCVPEDVKNNIKYYNQIGEVIDYKEVKK